MNTPSNAVSRWFGPGFEKLHPLLQDLHRHGGRLAGTVTIEYGQGFSGWLGQRLARKLGIPTDQNQCEFSVDIQHSREGMHWNRNFGPRHTLSSLFVPVGTYPTGYWTERTGMLQMCLTVDIQDGGWHWRLLRVQVLGVRLPLCLFPRTLAYKRIEDDQYRFGVEFALPALGKILAYQGLLKVDNRSIK